MTHQNNAAQAAVQDLDYVVQQLRQAGRVVDEEGELTDRLDALLSKLRPPLADERAAFEHWLQHDVDPALVGHGAVELTLARAAWSERGRRAALASAPVGRVSAAARATMDGCRCVLYGAGNPHWPCPLHSGAPVAGEAQPAAYLTLDEESSPSMLFFDVVEARGYCTLGEEPVPLFRHAAPQASAEAEIASYALPDGTRVERAAQLDGTYLWAVRRDGNCLGLDGHWSYEPLPSSRGDEWLALHRFRSAQAAIRALKKPQAAKDGGQQRAAFDHPVFAFLLGEGQLHGVDFGERAPGAVGKWWWRKDLRAALSATQTGQGERDA